MFNNRRLIVFVVIFLRILSSLYLLINPLWGFLLYVVLDYFDAYFLQHFAGMGWNSYQKLDKKIDILGLIVMIYWGYLVGNFWLFLAFSIYRFFGDFLFFLSGKQSVLVLFPNFVEPLFVWYVLLRNLKVGPSLLIALFLFQILLEYYLHSFWPNYLKKNDYPKFFRIFGLTRVKKWD